MAAASVIAFFFAAVLLGNVAFNVTGFAKCRLSKESFVGFHMARDEGLFILDWRQFYRPKNGSVRLDQSE